MTSTEVVFYAQLKGKLTKKCYKCATVFVDHFSCLRFTHLQLDNKSNETLAAKLAFKTWQNMESTCCTTIGTMVASMTTPSNKHAMMQGNAHLLWGECPLPKLHCRASHLRPLRKRMQATDPRVRPLARGGPLCIVAICLAKCSLPSQEPTSAGGWHPMLELFISI
jgi:hypothetical protein